MLEALKSEHGESFECIGWEIARATCRRKIAGALQSLALDLLILHRSAAIDGSEESLQEHLLHRHNLVLSCDYDRREGVKGHVFGLAELVRTGEIGKAGLD